MRLGSIFFEGALESFQNLLLVFAAIHIDEIDYDHTADVSQSQLTRNLLSRFQVGTAYGLGLGARTGETPRVNVDNGESLGGLND
ncbi:MAG: hypothetical protein BWY75_02908 [bacterium ADurb.Bin425]|nr:MAG: hypothetical protein BWY75_02908 [bacterium ADurb.Bin425]